MPKPSILGPQQDRAKTDLRIPRELLEQVEVVCRAMGVPKNAFFSLAAGMLLIQCSPLLATNKRTILLNKIGDMVQTILDEARKIA